MKIAFFTEAGYKRGMGHLIRCQTIADEFIKNKISVSFFLDSDINFDYLYKNINYFNWKNFSIKDSYDAIFVDSYEASLNTYELISKNSKLALYIDDYSRIKYPKGIIINFAANAKEMFLKQKNKKNEYLLGLKYIPIRDIFLENKNKKKDGSILIMLGGFDIKNLSVDIIKTLENINSKKVIVTNKDDVKNDLETYENIEVLFKPTHKILASKMSMCSLAISTASMTAYELSYLKIPTLITAVSKDQIIGISEMIKNKIAFSCIDINTKDWQKDLKIKIKNLISNNIDQKTIIDGLGKNRIVNHVIKRLCE